MNRSLHIGARLLIAGLMVLPVLLSIPVASDGSQFPQRGGQRGRDRSLEEAMQVPADQEIQLFNATVSRVRVDVIVTDDDGNFVTDLTAEDFSIFEDGEQQAILDVQLVDLAAGEIHPLYGDQPAPIAVSSGGEAAVRRSPSATESGGATPDAATPGSAAAELGAVIFLIDGPSLGQQARARFGDAWEDILGETATLQVPRAAYMVDNVGRLEELVPLGYDIEAMQDAAEAVRAAPLFGNTTRTRMVEIANDLNSPGIPGDVASRLAQAKAKSFEAEERNRSLATYELLTSFADALWTRSGRTAVVWVSTGIKLMQGGPYTAIFAQNPSATAEGMAGARFDVVSPDPQIQEAQEALHRAANGSNVSFYTVDPSLLMESRFSGGDIEVAYASGTALLDTPVVAQSMDGLRDSMRTAAAETGGKSFIHATDLGLVLQEIEQDTSRFYLVTYEPPAPDGDGGFHEIRVDVSRDDIDVRSRGGYVDHPPEVRAQRLIGAALALPGSVSDLPVEAEAFVSRPGPSAPNVLMAVAVDGSEVGIMLTQAGERRVSLDIHAVALKDDELYDESHEQLNARSADAGVFRAANETNPLAPTLIGYMAYQHEWTLPPGNYTLNVAAFDNVTGRIGASSIQVEVPEDEAGWGISDPLLVTVDDAGRPQPIVMGRVVEGRNLAVFLEVYGGMQPILSGQVFLEATAEEDQQGAKLFPMALRRVAQTVHRGSAPLPPGMPPGRYVVQLVITDPAAEEHQVVRLPVEVVALPAR